MKRSILGWMLLPVACGAFAADGLTVNLGQSTSVTLYGTLDGGVWLQSKATDGSGNGPTSAGSQQKFVSGGISPSKWGITGKRDLSGGKSAFFKLEAHLNSGNGSDGDFGDTGFTRQAFVGFSAPFGTVTVGQQFTPATLAFAATDPRGLRESLSGLQPWLFTSNFGAMGSNFLSAFAHNSVQYSVDIDKLNVAALYGIGGKAGSSKADGTWSLAATYSGPVTVSAGVQTDYANSGVKGASKFFAGVGATFGDFSPKLNYLNAKQYDTVSGQETHNHKIVGVGFDWKAAQAHNVNVSLYSGKDSRVSGNKATTWVLSDEYAYESNITLYAQLAVISAKSAADIGVSLLGGSGTLVQGATTTVVNAGFRFNF
ncbi:putative Porin, Gram-negative type [Rubrivivax sp. A210]|uniref:porin n=1 Tax=Rubrivivax sp. A210 TaxID=2772301 RepID=UPI001918E28A|nr:porin [Rubrivivax sp. A210]CAD5372760.1 putative Porin, Gram-negative type [Rubrivivax sp. A210]